MGVGVWVMCNSVAGARVKRVLGDGAHVATNQRACAQMKINEG